MSVIKSDDDLAELNRLVDAARMLVTGSKCRPAIVCTALLNAAAAVVAADDRVSDEDHTDWALESLETLINYHKERAAKLRLPSELN